MNDPKHVEIQRWLTKSQHDLGSARLLMTGREVYLDTAVYHCQQAGEKALKAFLTYHDIVFERTHDLRVLLEQSIDVEPALEQWQEVAEELTPYSVLFRYPGDVMEPEMKEAECALNHVQDFVDFIMRLLPEEFRS